MKRADYWLNKWGSETAFVKHRRQKAHRIIDELIGGYLIKNVLDIGCGLAIESAEFQKYFDCELFLIEGDSENTLERPRSTAFGPTKTFSFYNSLDALTRAWDNARLRYCFVDANNPELGQLKFDLIYSGMSCGFHYPLSAYKDVLYANSHDATSFIFDLRKGADQGDLDFEIQDVLIEDVKHDTCLIKLKG